LWILGAGCPLDENVTADQAKEQSIKRGEDVVDIPKGGVWPNFRVARYPGTVRRRSSSDLAYALPSDRFGEPLDPYPFQA